MESVRASVRASFIGTALQVDLPAVGGARALDLNRGRADYRLRLGHPDCRHNLQHF